MTMETYTTGTGQKLLVHDGETCRGQACVIHDPSFHKMNGWPTHWRADRGLMERLCAHGIGHPDPDDLEFKRGLKGDKYMAMESIHGCDGCCCGQ